MSARYCQVPSFWEEKMHLGAGLAPGTWSRLSYLAARRKKWSYSTCSLNSIEGSMVAA